MKIPSKITSLIGVKTGDVTVVDFFGRGTGGEPRWLCLCSCGKKWDVSASSIRRGRLRSCGCRKLEFMSAASKKHGQSYGKNENGGPATEYKIWQGIKSRCFNPKCTQYKNYGARGITMCESWRTSFEQFLKDVGKRPSGTCIDRINNNGNYEPGNVRWVTQRQQMNNTRLSVRVEFDGVSKTLAEWAREKGLDYRTFYSRLRHGWSVERAITEPATRKKKR